MPPRAVGWQCAAPYAGDPIPEWHRRSGLIFLFFILMLKNQRIRVGGLKFRAAARLPRSRDSALWRGKWQKSRNGVQTLPIAAMRQRSFLFPLSVKGQKTRGSGSAVSKFAPRRASPALRVSAFWVGGRMG